MRLIARHAFRRIRASSTIAAYCETGVLRRLDVTPIGPRRVLSARWLGSAASLGVAIVVTGILAWVAFDAVAPRSVAFAFLAMLVGTIAMMAVGSLIAASAGTAQIAMELGCGSSWLACSPPQCGHLDP